MSLHSQPLHSHKRPAFGFWTATSLVVGNMIGAGIFFLPSSLASIGTISLLGWVITAIGAMCLASIFARLSLVFPKAGGPYVHTQSVFGNVVGFLMAWGYWIMSWTSNAAVAIAFVSYLSLFFPLLANSPWLSFVAASLVIWATTAMNCIGVRVGALIQLTTAILKMLPLIAIPAVGIFFLNIENFKAINLTGHSHFDAVSAAAALTLWAFIGLEAATVPDDNEAISGKIISRATLIGTFIVAAAYVVTTIVLFGLVPVEELAGSNAPYADAAAALFGPYAGTFIGICVLISAFGGLNGWILLQGQIPYTLAKEGLFPKKFLTLSSKGAPVFGLITTSVLITLLLLANMHETLANQFQKLVVVGSIMTLIAYLMASISAFILFRRSSRLTLGLQLAIVIGAFYALWAILGVGWNVLLQCAFAYAAGLPVFMLGRYQHHKSAQFLSS